MGEKSKSCMALWGTWTTDSKVVGFCLKHRAYITVTQLERKQCLQKGCKAFRRKDHPYWERRERIKEIKRLKKEAGIPSWQKVEIRTDHEGNLLPKVKNKN